MKLVIIGSGYVGLATGTCLARFGNNVVCVDVDESRVSALRQGEVPFYEPGLSDMMKRNMAEERLSFTTRMTEALKDAEACFICVGTPSSQDGGADLTYVEQASRDIANAMKANLKANAQNAAPLLVVVKSTSPVGTNAKVKKWISEELGDSGVEFVMASNPEFLREGSAVRDFTEPERVVIGVDSEMAEARMRAIYSFTEPEKLIFMDIPSAEMTKYAANAMLATRISFMNEMANICERVGANVDSLRKAMALDSRIGGKFLYAGCGYGGSCFPKDVRALCDFARASGYDSRILTAVDEVNVRQKEVLYEKLSACFAAGGGLEGKTIALWGLAFKPKTSDTREAPALTLIQSLLDARARIQAHDPRAIDETRRYLGERQGLLYTHDPYDAVNGADALVVATEWDVYRQPDFERVRRLLNSPLIVDGRNLYSLSEMKKAGFRYYSVGRAAV
ncbi:UDP-glucose 6-dehydrogenase [Synergistales bacterium]|nr:UDP-glucose 6-dehydrogenase [Synergistales bacterium]